MSYYRGDGLEYRPPDLYYPSSYDRERRRDRNSYLREPAYSRSYAPSRPINGPVSRYHAGPRQMSFQNERERNMSLDIRQQRYSDNRSYRPVNDFKDSRRESHSTSRYRSFSRSPSPHIPTGPRNMRDESQRRDRFTCSSHPRYSRTDHGVGSSTFAGTKVYAESPRIYPEITDNFHRNSFPSRRSGDFVDYRLSDSRSRYDRNNDQSQTISRRSESESFPHKKSDSKLPRARSDSFHPRCFHDSRGPENVSYRPRTASSSLLDSRKPLEYTASTDDTVMKTDIDDSLPAGRERSQSLSSHSSVMAVVEAPSLPISSLDEAKRNQTTPAEDLEEGQIEVGPFDSTLNRDGDFELTETRAESKPTIDQDQEELFEEMQQLDQDIICKQEEILHCQSQQQELKEKIALLERRAECGSSSSSEYDESELIGQIKRHCQSARRDDLYNGRTYSSLNRYSFQRINPEVKKAIYARLRQRSSKILEKEKRLAIRYKEFYESWESYCLKLEKEDTKKSSAPSPSINSMTRNTRRGTAVGDVVLSEAEFSEILLQLEQENLRDPIVRAKLTSASIPPMILDPIQKSACIQDYNNLVRDPIEHYSCKQEVVWTEEEKEKFAKAYAVAPKQFGKIASELPGRTAPDCVLYYYRSKKFSDYRSLVAPKGRRHTLGKGKAKGRQSALMKDLRADDEEEEDGEEEGEKEDVEEESKDVLTPVDRVPRKRVSRVGGRGRGRVGKLRKESTPIEAREEEAATVLTFLQQGVSIPEPCFDTENGDQSRSSSFYSSSSSTVKRSVTNSYWSVEEKFELERLLSIYGRNWTAIAEGLPAKTTVQVKNFYSKNEASLFAIADEAEQRLRALIPNLPDNDSKVDSPASSNPDLTPVPNSRRLPEKPPDRPTWRAESLPLFSMSNRYTTTKRPASQPLLSFFTTEERSPEPGWFPLGLTCSKSIFEKGENGKISLPPLRPSNLPCAPDSPAFGQWTTSVLPLSTQQPPRLYTSSNERHSIGKPSENENTFHRTSSTDKSQPQV